MLNGAAFITKGQSETTVPFRSPLTVVLGRPYLAKEKKSDNIVEYTEQRSAETSEVLRIFADRYQLRNERKHRFTPFKDNNISRPGDVRVSEHASLENDLALINRRYKLYHSESSSDKNTEMFFEKINALPNALQKIDEPKKSTVTLTNNARAEKKGIHGELGEHVRRRMYRPQSADRLHTIKARNTRGLGDGKYNTARNAQVSTIPVTLARKKNLDRRLGRNDSAEISHEVHEEKSGFQVKPKPLRSAIDQAINEWRKQRGNDSRWMAPQSAQSDQFLKKDTTRNGDLSENQREYELPKRQRGVKKTTKFTTDINVKDIKSAKITLRRLLQETALSHKSSDSQVKNKSGDEVPMRPTARRMTIRAKCSELLAIKTDNPEQEEKRRQLQKTQDSLDSGTKIRLERKKSETCIPDHLKSDGDTAHLEEWTMKRPPAKKRPVRIKSSELLSVRNQESGTEAYESPEPRTSTDEYLCRPMKRQRQKQLGDEVLSFEHSLNDRKNLLHSEGNQRSEDNDVKLAKTYDDGELTNDKREVSRGADKQIPSPEEGENMTVDLFELGKNGLVINSVAPVSVTIVKEFGRENAPELNKDEKENGNKKKLPPNASANSQDNTMLMLTGRQSREEVKDVVVMHPNTDEVNSRKDMKLDNSPTMVTNEEEQSWEDRKGNFEAKTTYFKRKNKVRSDKNKVIPISPSTPTDYSEIWTG